MSLDFTFMLSITSFKLSLIQHDVHFVNEGPIYFKIDNKAAYALGEDLVIDRLLPRRAVMSCSAVQMFIVLKDTPRTQPPASRANITF